MSRVLTIFSACFAGWDFATVCDAVGANKAGVAAWMAAATAFQLVMAWWFSRDLT